MNILNIGGATAIIEHKGVRILCDPWLDDGIFHGSWHHFPSANMRIEDLGHLDYIVISHIHEDHCSPGTIKHLKSEIPLESNTITLMEDPRWIKDQSLSVKVSSTLLSMFLIGHVSRNIADAALFIEYQRLPNHYDPEIQTLWNYLKI